MNQALVLAVAASAGFSPVELPEVPLAPASRAVAYQGSSSSSWPRYAEPSGKFSIEVPCRFTYSTDPRPAGVSHVYACRTGDETYIAVWIEAAPAASFDAQVEMRAARDAVVNGMGAVLLNSTPLTVGGRPAHDYTANRQGQQLLSSRVIADGRRLYMVGVITPLGQDRSASIRRFISTLKIN